MEGRKRRATSPLQADSVATCSYSKKTKIDTCCEDTEHWKKQVGKCNVPRIDVPSLKSVCTKFVAHNIHLVDSLVDFPDIVGFEIYAQVKETGALSDPTLESTHKTLQLFAQAYEETFLNALNLRPFAGLRLEECSRSFQNFNYISKLDLGHCKLGDGHELFTFISQLCRLECLGLEHNILSNFGLQKMTSPLRVLGRGPTGISVLDLSGNSGITDKGLKYLLCFPRLHLLDMSGTSISEIGIAQLEAEFRLREVTNGAEIVEFERPSLCDTSGWAGDVVRAWTIRPAVIQGPSSSSSSNTGSKPANFYGKRRRQREFSTPIDNSTPKSCPRFKLRFRAQSSTFHDVTSSASRNVIAGKGATKGVENEHKRKSRAKLSANRRNIKDVIKLVQENDIGGSDGNRSANSKIGFTQTFKSHRAAKGSPSQEMALGGASHCANTAPQPKGDKICLDDDMALLSGYVTSQAKSNVTSLWDAMSSSGQW